MTLYLCDIDGTIADNKHREWVLKDKSRPYTNWDLFFNMMGDDKPVEPMRDLLGELYFGNYGTVLIYVTGRPERFRQLTVDWLQRSGFPMPVAFPNGKQECFMYMRADGDHRPDHIIKGEMLDAICKDGFDKPLMVFDDRNSVVSMWRERGLLCAQVAEGNF